MFEKLFKKKVKIDKASILQVMDSMPKPKQTKFSALASYKTFLGQEVFNVDSFIASFVQFFSEYSDDKKFTIFHDQNVITVRDEFGELVVEKIGYNDLRKNEFITWDFIIPEQLKNSYESWLKLNG